MSAYTPKLIQVLHDLLMIVMRVGWIVLAVVTVWIGIDAASSGMGQITNCEIGMLSREVPNLGACNALIWSYFGIAVVPVLAVPVAVCLIPVWKPRQGVSWLAVAALFALSVVGFFPLLVSSTPTWVDLYGFFWQVIPLAVLVAGVVSLVNLSRSGPTRDSLQRGSAPGQSTVRRTPQRQDRDGAHVATEPTSNKNPHGLAARDVPS